MLRLSLLNLVAVSNLLAQAVVPLPSPPVAGCLELLFDQGWRFHLGGAEGADAMFFDDSGWRTMNLPHDWSIEDSPGTDSPCDSNATSQVSGGFTVGGTGWYRKSFTLPADQKGRRVIIQFETLTIDRQSGTVGGPAAADLTGSITGAGLVFVFTTEDSGSFGNFKISAAPKN